MHWTKIAGPYWPSWAAAFPPVWEPYRCLVVNEGREKRASSAGLLDLDADRPLLEVVEESGFKPSGRRSHIGTAMKVSSGQQPTKRVMPQLIPDGLEPDVHLQVALATVHPVERPPFVEDHVKAALSVSQLNAEFVNCKRSEMANLLAVLAESVSHENLEMILHVHPLLQPVVIPRNVAFMREIQFVVGTRDHAFCRNIF